MNRRLLAIAALALQVGAIILAIVVGIRSFPNGLVVLACVLAAAAAGAWGAVRLGIARVLGLATAALLLIGAVALVVLEGNLAANLVIIGLVALSLAATRQVFRAQESLPDAPKPARPVLFYNPKSGGGKAERFAVAAEARARGVEPIELGRGDDLATIVRQAIDRGADAVGMAGGDGSQAIVAAIAAEHGLPYVCVPAGTRNHFALDLGVDRDDVVGALDAFNKGGERVVDLAEVNDRVFVNNVSLGVYAEAVQRTSYRDAKLRTLAETVPAVLGPEAQGLDLHWTEADGGDYQTSAVVLVSNDPYRLGAVIGSGTRPRLDAGRLGIAVIGAHGADGTTARGIRQWTAPMFEVGSDRAIAAGIDGESIQLDPPLRFRTRPAALRVRIAPQHPGISPSARMPANAWEGMLGLWRVAILGPGRS